MDIIVKLFTHQQAYLLTKIVNQFFFVQIDGSYIDQFHFYLKSFGVEIKWMILYVEQKIVCKKLNK